MSVRDFYTDRSVLVTGGTGFIGRFLVYRLLETCDLRNVYVVIRSKRGLDTCEREKRFKSEQIFNHLSDQTLLNKIHVISGDLEHERLGISVSDQQELVDNVTVVFHCASSIRLTQSLKEATNSNLRGTLNVLNLVRQFAKVQSLVYVSSIANWFNKTLLEEKLYEAEVPFFGDCRSFINEVNSMSDEQAERFSGQHVGAWPKYPNNYSFTKTLCEVMLKREECSFRVCVVRLPLMFSCLKVPEPGWVDKPQTGTAIVSLFANGLIRTTRFDPNYEFNHIPLDMCVNVLIAVAWFTTERGTQSYDIVNLNCTRSNPITIREVSNIASKLGHEYPSIRQIRPAKGGLKERPNRIVHSIHSFFTHTIFYYLLDVFLWLTGQKPVFVKMMGRALDGVSQIEKILRSEADVVAEKIDRVYESISQSDRLIFFYDPKEIDWLSLLTAHHLRFRRVFLREDAANMEKAKLRMKHVSSIYGVLSLIPVVFGVIAFVITAKFISSVAGVS